MSRYKVYEIVHSKYGDITRGIYGRDYLKAKCIDTLENTGYNNKNLVDLRSVESMAKYLFGDIHSFRALN